MSKAIPPRQETARETPYFAGRLKTLGIIGAILLFIVAARLTYLCVIKGDQYLLESQEQIFRTESISAPRGVISDRFGRLLATNRITYSAYLSPHRLTSGTLTRSVERLEALTDLEINRSQTHQRYAPLKDPSRPLNRPFTKLLLAQGLTLPMATTIAERQALEMPGISVEEAFERTYETPYCSRRGLSHVIGFIGKLNRRDIERERERGAVIDPENDRIGKMSLEAAYEEALRGEKGSQNQIFDSRGRRIREPDVIKQAVSGSNLVLTLDVDLQQRAAELMRPFSRKEGNLTLGGALVALDPRDGEILAMVSMPDFDYSDTSDAPQDQFNRALDGRFSPGSTFKLVTASAGLRDGIPPEERFTCERYWPFYNIRFKCLFHHGDLDMFNAMRASCNVYFYELGSILRWGKIADAAWEYGFGQSPGVDIGSGGRPQILELPPMSQEDVLNGDVVQMGIGQGGLIEVSPLQMAVAYAAVAHPQGLRMRPHLLKEMVHPDGRREPWRGEPGAPSPASDPYVRDNLIEAFRLVVEATNGTAHKAEFDPAWKVAGKTGSAEYYGCEPGEENAWFIGFAPWDNPEICVAVLCERSGHGGDVAAPVAKDFLQTYFDVTRPKLLRETGLEVAEPVAIVSTDSADAVDVAVNNPAP